MIVATIAYLWCTLRLRKAVVAASLDFELARVSSLDFERFARVSENSRRDWEHEFQYRS